jgi:ABC-type molybdenum transport system ATPase subunit/photorepair protein PhrA
VRALATRPRALLLDERAEVLSKPERPETQRFLRRLLSAGRV